MNPYYSCSVDPYLFENFNTVDGDFLAAKFRAFKFPDSTYVQFRGTVNVCLDKCKGIECSNGQTGFGRRKREIQNADSNRLYEINMATFIKVNYDGNPDKKAITESEESLKQLKIANQKLARNSRENVFESVQVSRSENLNSDTAKVEETSIFTKEVFVEDSSMSSSVFLLGNIMITFISFLLNRLF